MDSKFRIEIDKSFEGFWSFGIGIMRYKDAGEFILYINLFKWYIDIGWF